MGSPVDPRGPGDFGPGAGPVFPTRPEAKGFVGARRGPWQTDQLLELADPVLGRANLGGPLEPAG